jgi:hypothetical protein
MRDDLTRFGVRPEKNFPVFVPHVTIASFDRFDPAALAQANLFLSENSDVLESIQVKGSAKIMRTLPKEKQLRQSYIFMMW